MRGDTFRSDERGFTIVEVMVAAMILVVGILGVTTIVNTSNATTTSNKAREQGLALARELVEATRSIRYQSVRPDTVVSTIQAMPGFANAAAGKGWTIKRRGIVYSVSLGVCSVDDPSDGVGAHVANQFCLNPIVKAKASDCKTLIGSPASISGTGGGGALAGDCGIDSNLDGTTDNLVQTSASTCASNAVGVSCDSQPDDFKRVVALITWDRGSGSRYVLQQATIAFPGLSAYGAVTSLLLHGQGAPPAGGYVVSTKAKALQFDVTTSQNANQVNWLLDGADKGAIPGWSGSSGSFTWDLGNDAPDSETAPASGEVVDGSYTVGARVQDAAGIHGIEQDTTVTLNRRVPFPATGFSIWGTKFDTTVTPNRVLAIDSSWNAVSDRDVIGWHFWRYAPGNQSVAPETKIVCDITVITARHCADPNPPGGQTVQYWVTAVDRDSTSGQARDGQKSAVLSIAVGNQPPTVPPIGLGLTSNSKWVTISWGQSTDYDGAVDWYEVQKQDANGNWQPYPSTGTTFTATTLSAPTDKNVAVGSTYAYRVRAKDKQGAYSDWSTASIKVG